MSIPFYIYNKNEVGKPKSQSLDSSKKNKLQLKIEDENKITMLKLSQKFEFTEKEKKFISENLQAIKFMNIMIILLAYNVKKFALSNEYDISSKKRLKDTLYKYFETKTSAQRFDSYLRKKKCVDKEGELLMDTIAYQLYIYLKVMNKF